VEYTEHPKPGDYHIVGKDVVLRAAPRYQSAAIATLANGEGVYVYGDVETDPNWVLMLDNSVKPNAPTSDVAGLDYIKVATQSHGVGWVAMLLVEPGAGNVAQPAMLAPTPPSTGKVIVVAAGVISGAALLAWLLHKATATPVRRRRR
jgi:hypothetical protein